jgi:hypothetical protein
MYRNRSVKALSWIDNQTTVICQLDGGLTNKGHIRAYTNYRKHIEYEVRRARGQLDGVEEDEFEHIPAEVMSMEEANSYLQRSVQMLDPLKRVRIGTVVDFKFPHAESRAGVLFVVQYNDSVDYEEYSPETLRPLLC